MISRFYRLKSEFQRFQRTLKQHACPHCQRTGFLILHGYLYGYDEHGGAEKIKRGRRVFCSNRNRRQGCGRTFSCLADVFIKNFILTTQSLWKFLQNFISSANKYQSFARLNLPFSATTVYRIFQRFNRRQSFLRSRLTVLCAPPCVDDTRPLLQTIRHLQSAFQNAPCPLSALQSRMQISLL